MKKKSPHAKAVLSVIILALATMLVMQSCDNKPATPVPVANRISSEDTTEATLQCFESLALETDTALAFKNRVIITAPIVFSGTVKETGTAKPGAKIFVYGADGKEYTGGSTIAGVTGGYSFPRTDVKFPIVVVADNLNDGFYLEAVVIKDLSALPAVLDFDIKANTGTRDAESNLSVFVKNSSGTALVKRRVTFSSDILGNTWYTSTDSKGLAVFTHLVRAATICSIYNDNVSIPNFNFSTVGITRRANVSAEMILP